MKQVFATHNVLFPSLPHFKKKMHANMTKLWREAIKEFVETVALRSAGLVHVDTGMSKASIIPLAKVVRIAGLVRASIVPNRYKKTPKYYHFESNTPSGLKTISHGIELGEKVTKVDFGSPRDPVMTLEFSINVLQYFLNEEGVGNNNSVAWRSFEQGHAAFEKHITENMGSIIPDVADWFLSGVHNNG